MDRLILQRPWIYLSKNIYLILFCKRFSSQEIHSRLKYELFAVAAHLGTTINSGHYIARVKRNNNVNRCL